MKIKRTVAPVLLAIGDSASFRKRPPQREARGRFSQESATEKLN
jgi:hypothetical protein